MIINLHSGSFKALSILALVFFTSFMVHAQDLCTPVGWATQNGGVTGGGNATPVVVSSYSALKDAVTSETVAVVHIQGTITFPSNGRITIQDLSNKSIFGLPGSKLVSTDLSSGGSGIFYIKRVENLIIRNVTFEGPGAYDTDGNDNLTVDDCRNVWVDHCEFHDGMDGNFDIKNKADYISVTWCTFSYEKPPIPDGPGGSDDHRYTNLIGSSDGATGDRGKLRVTFQYCWWGEGCRERMPRVRYGKVHLANNYFSSSVSNYCIRAGYEADLLIEGNYFDDQNEPVDYQSTLTAVKVSNNIGVSNSTSGGTAFNPPYSLSVANPNDIVTPIKSCAGATLDGPDGCSSCGGGGGTTDCAGVENGDAYADNCGRCVGGTTGAVACATSLKEGIYRIHPVHSDLCLTNNNPSTQETCSDVVSQYWEVISDGNNYQIRSLDNDQYLSPGSGVQGENTGSSSSPASLTLADAGNGNYYISPSDNGSLVFDILNISTATGMPAILWENTGAGNQHFRFEAVTVTLDCHGDLNGTASLDACGVCSGGNTGVEPCSAAIQGEDFCEGGDGVLESDNGGFQGEGYFNYDNLSGTAATWFVTAAGTQTATLSIRYANGGSAARPLSVSINGSNQGTISGNITDAWTTWVSEDISVNLNDGRNEITLTATASEGGPNIDLIALPSGLSPASCTSSGPTDCNGDVGGSAYTDNCGECVGGNTGKLACEVDCNGVPGGTAFLDNCNECVGGNTGKTACVPSCDNNDVIFGQTGFSTMAGGTTGGAGGDVVYVSTGNDLQNAINDANGPRTIYVNGTITMANSEGLSKIDIKDVSDITIEGVGDMGELDGIGLKIWRASNIIIKNVKVHHVLSGDKDGLNIEGPSDHIWVDHCEFYNEYQGVDKDYYDALLDLKRDVDYVTISWNYFHDSWKCSLSGSSESDTYNRTVTYHHNYYENINSRLPLFRSGTGHMFNNYYKDIASTAINSRINACVKIENNHFVNVLNPYVTAYSDVDGYGDISGNILTNSTFEYSSDTRELTSCSANIPYNYSEYLNCAEAVESIVPVYSGVNKSLVITGINKNRDSKLKAFPNPTEGIINLSDEMEWVLLNALGNEVMSGNSSELDLSVFNSGVYFLKAGHQVIQIIKK